MGGWPAPERSARPQGGADPPHLAYSRNPPADRRGPDAAVCLGGTHFDYFRAGDLNAKSALFH